MTPVGTSVSIASLLFSSGGASDWVAETVTAIDNSNHAGGLLGMLANSGGDGSVNSFLGHSAIAANAFATISQTSVSNASSLIARIASQHIQEQNQKKLNDAIASLQATQNMVQPTNKLDDFIYFPDGTHIDTKNNIMTMSDGTQYDTITGAKYVDPASIVQMANGAYLDTKNNIMTMPNGTRIDIVTGLAVTKTA